jgi:hypothetical protein
MYVFLPSKIIAAIMITLFSTSYILYCLVPYMTGLTLIIEKQAMLLWDGHNQFIYAALSQMNKLLKMNLIAEEEFEDLSTTIKVI